MMIFTAEIVYLLSSATSLLCAVLLLRSYQRNRARLLFWSGLCFMFMCINSVMLFLDVIVFSSVDLSTWRLIPALLGVSMLCYGLIEGDA